MTGRSPSPAVPQSLSVLERITYVNEDTGDTIARVPPRDRPRIC